MIKADFVNPFLKAAYQVLEFEVQAQVEKGELSLQESYFTSNDITVMIGVVGDLKGMVLYGMSERTAKNLVSVMMGTKVPVFDSMAESAIAEMGNVITGAASSELEKAGYSCRLAPPSLIIGRGTVISTINIKRLVIPLKTQYGELEIGVALRESHEPSASTSPS